MLSCCRCRCCCCVLFSLFGDGAAGRRRAAERGGDTLQAAKRGGASVVVTGRRRRRKGVQSPRANKESYKRRAGDAEVSEAKQRELALGAIRSVMHTEMLTALLRPGDMRVQRDNIAPMHEMCAGRLIISGDAMIYSSTAPSHATFFA